jgi:hypothetical protein
VYETSEDQQASGASSFYSTVGAKLMGQVQERYRTTSVWIRVIDNTTLFDL